MKIKGPFVNIGNRFNKVFPSFDLFNKLFAPSSQLMDIFSSHISFHFSNKQSNNNLKTHIHLLNDIALNSSADPTIALIVFNASIKNNIAISIVHIYVYNKQVIKTLHHAVNVMSTEAELFTIRCGINQATNMQSIKKVIIITDFIFFFLK